VQLHWIWLATRDGLGDRGRMALLQRFADAEDIYFAGAGEYAQVEGLSQEALSSLQDKSLRGAEQIVSDCRREDIHILTWRDALYPKRLKNIPDPPVVLYYKGQLPEVDALPLIGVVGTRKASAYGLTTAKRMGYQLAMCGAVVVSGVATGVDSMAMRGALTAGTPLIGVLGCGADVVYPPSNHPLYADTIRQGCLLTEFPPGTPPMGWNFPRRNRIMSGLSCGVLVVEAPEKSGALITARLAADQGRDVFVVPGNIDVDSCKGSNALLRDGAIAVSSGWDVVSEYEAQFPGKIRKNTRPAQQAAYPDEVEAAGAESEKSVLKVAQNPKTPEKKSLRTLFVKKKEIDNMMVASYIDAEASLPDLSPEENKLVMLLRQEIELVDDLIAAAQMPAGQVLAVLTMLEIKGVVTRLPGKRVTLKK
jgi:DNA processing protein